MKFTLLVSHEAREGTNQAFFWYDNIAESVGDNFLSELEKCYLKLSANPLAYGFLNKSGIVRFLKLNKFPYVVIYLVVGNTVNVISVRHTSRRPFF